MAAKDGTNRGGKRIGAGRKRNTADLTLIKCGAKNQRKIKPPRKYLSGEQKDGEKLAAKKIFAEVMDWLRDCHCEGLLPQSLIESYAMAMARHIQAEQYLSSYGLLAKHPTSGEPCTSPFVKISQSYLKEAQLLWSEIFSACKANAPDLVRADETDAMAKLFKERDNPW